MKIIKAVIISIYIIIQCYGRENEDSLFIHQIDTSF